MQMYVMLARHRYVEGILINFKGRNNKSVIWHRWFVIQLLMLVIWLRRMRNTIDLTVEYLLNLFRLVSQYLSWFIVFTLYGLVLVLRQKIDFCKIFQNAWWIYLLPEYVRRKIDACDAEIQHFEGLSIFLRHEGNH